jgi:aryl-alcohol dehydrogenase-like predicted oxidoreductase
LLHAFEKGINFVDTAELYGKGRSEEVIGRALKEWRGDRIYVATKAQPTVWPNASDDRPTIRGRYPSWHLRQNVDQSLKRLQVERLDLLQLHCWMADGCTVLDWLETLNALKLEGKIDQIGVSIRDYRPSEGLDLARLGLVNSIQVVLNLFEQRPAADLFQRGMETATAFIARVPLDSGSLTGTWHADTYNTWRDGSVPAWLFRGERFSETLRRIDALKTLCRPYYASLAEAAMRYVLSVPGLTTVIPGMSNPCECDLNIAFSDGAPFPRELADQLAAHAWPRNFYQ